MKKIWFTLGLVFLTFIIFAQTQNQAHTDLPIDERLHDVYETDYLERLKIENPFLLQRWNFYLDHAWYITDLPNEKDSESYTFISIADLDKVNILLLEKEQNLKKDWNKQQVYKIENTNKVLVYYAGKEFTKKLNEHLNRTHSSSKTHR